MAYTTVALIFVLCVTLIAGQGENNQTLNNQTQSNQTQNNQTLNNQTEGGPNLEQPAPANITERNKILEEQRLLDQSQRSLEAVLADCTECTSALTGFMSPDKLQKMYANGPITVLVPTNMAIQMAGSLSNLGERQQEQLLKLHILKGNITMLQEGAVPGLSGIENVTRTPEGALQINGATIIGSYQPAKDGNGYYLIDKVLRPAVPTQLAAAPDSSLQGSQAGQSQPGNAQGQGQGSQPNQGGQLSQPDPNDNSVWGLITRDPNVSIIGQSLVYSPEVRMELTFPLTFFFPSDQALNDAAARTQNLPDEDLTKIVKFHTVRGFITDFQDGQELPTMDEGQSLVVRKVGNNVTINGANIIQPLKQGTNQQGYYIIDKLLFPSNLSGLTSAQQGQMQGEIVTPQGGNQGSGSQGSGSQGSGSQQGLPANRGQ